MNTAAALTNPIPIKWGMKFYAFIGFIAAILVAHLLILAFYVNQHLQTSNNIMNPNSPNFTLVKLLQSASNNMNPIALNNYINNFSNSNLKLDDYNIKINLSSSPLWSLQYNGDNAFTNLENYLTTHVETTAFSVQLANKQWLNYKVSLSSNFYLVAALMIILELVLIKFVLLYVWSIWRFTAPLKKFKQSAEQLGIDVNAEPINATGPALVRETANALNQMQQRIQNLIDGRTKMLAAISHDLRTPITRLKLRAQFLTDEVEAEKFNHDLDEMEAMIASVLNFAKTDAPHEQKVKFDLNALILSICYDFTDRGCPVRFLSDEQQRLTIVGRSLSLKRTFTNLIENGVKYGGEVAVKINATSSQQLTITLEDNGPGIAEAELQKVFEPYYRAKSQSIAGTGLGLTIAYEVIHAHDGTITLENRPHGGLKVTVTLPI